MLLYEKFGISKAGVDPVGHVRAVESYEAQVAKRTKDIWTDLKGLAISRSTTAVRFYLVGDYANARKYGAATLPAAAEYLFGDWRSVVKTDLGTIDPAWWHGWEPWMHVFGAALLWGTTLGEWDQLRRIAAYPDEQRGIDSMDCTAALRELYIEIARHIRGEGAAGVFERVRGLKGADWRRTDALAKAFDAIIAKDEATVNRALGEFFAARRARKRSKDITDTISMDGSSVVNLARRAGLTVRLDAKYEDYYLTLPS